MGRRVKPSTEHPDEPATRLPPQRYALGLLTPKKDGCTMTMLLARGVKIETIDELLAAGLAIKRSELVGRGRPIEISRIAITEACRLYRYPNLRHGRAATRRPRRNLQLD